METETMTAGDGDGGPSPDVPSTDRSNDPVITDAESVLDNLLDVVRKQAEGILDTARSEAESETEAARTRAATERDEVLSTARSEADDLVQKAQQSAADQCASVLAVVEASIAELSRIEDYRARLEALATQLRETVGNVVAYREVDPEALQMLAGELGDEACREVIDTFVTELAVQLDELAAAVEADDVKSKKVARVLHNLSSGCATVGASDLAKLCHDVTPETLAGTVDQLVQRGNTVRAEVIRLRDNDLADGGAVAGLGDDAP